VADSFFLELPGTGISFTWAYVERILLESLISLALGDVEAALSSSNFGFFAAGIASVRNDSEVAPPKKS